MKDKFEWIDDNLNPILPELKHDPIKSSYEFKYDALVNKDMYVNEDEKERMYIYFKTDGEYDKANKILNKWSELEQLKITKLNKLLHGIN